MQAQTRQQIQRILIRNKRIYLNYNRFRQNLFAQLAPQESEIVLYLLPWLLSINDPGCPGYIPRLKRPFRVYNIEASADIKSREKQFKRMFGIHRRGSLIKPTSKSHFIQGLYTIGSIGTVSQTSMSDCDIWICYDQNQFDQAAWHQMIRKINLIKDWIDQQIKMSIYFFVSDLEAICQNRFGRVDSESSGSTQQNILKEEFYRTCILIAGKIPLWWVCYNQDPQISYAEAATVAQDEDFWEYDLIDMGNLDAVPQSEYFGAALWQINKSLIFPLKSIMKMALLKMLLDAPQERLMCHQFRDAVYTRAPSDPYPDCSLFTAGKIFDAYHDKGAQLGRFLKECFYLRCELRAYSPNPTVKEKIIKPFLKRYPIDRKRLLQLEESSSWNFNQQTELGAFLFKQLLQIYREISATHSDTASESDKRDLTCLGRKISACYLKKRAKVPIVHKPIKQFHLLTPTFAFQRRQWRIYSADDSQHPIVSSGNIIVTIAFLVWNGFFESRWVRMRPNTSHVTLQEVINLGNTIRDFFGIYETHDIDFECYLAKENITKLLLVADFEKSPWQKMPVDYTTVYLNSWGELFVRRFNTYSKLESFLDRLVKRNPNIITRKYVQRNPTAYEKTIARVRKTAFSPGEN